MKNNVIIYLSELGILTEIDGKVKKKYGENFDNDSNIEEYLNLLEETSLEKDSILDLLVFGIDKNKVVELWSALKVKFQCTSESKTSFESLENIIFKYDKLEEKTIIKVTDEEKSIFLLKEKNSFNRAFKEMEYKKEIFVKTNNKSFFDIKNKKSKNIKVQKENLSNVATEKADMREVFGENFSTKKRLEK